MASNRAHTRGEPPPLSDVAERQKRAAARAAAELLEDGMRLGLGTGSTVAHLLPAIAERALSGLVCVATSPATERAAHALGLTLQSLDELGELDLAIDGADQIDPAGWLIKGGGGAHTREKIVAGAAARFVVIASAEKDVETLTAPVPLEILGFGMQATLRAIGQARLRPPKGTETAIVSPDGGMIADYHGEIGNPRALAARLDATPGVVDHGLFAPEMVSLMLIAREEGLERRPGAGPAV